MSAKRPERKRDLVGLLGEHPLDLTREVTATDVQQLGIQMLRTGQSQPRRFFDPVKLSELAASIREHGILQPLLVRPVKDGYEIVAGERRWRAAQQVGLTTVPVIVRELTDEQASAAALIENLQRENLNVIDEVDGKLELVALTLGLSRSEARGRLMQLLRSPPAEEHERLEEVFRSLGESWQGFAKNKLRILNWPAPLLEALRGGLPLTLASVIVGAPQERQDELLAMALAGAARTRLMEAAKAGSGATSPSAEQVAKLLGSKRFIAGLDAASQRSLERWLAKIPPVMRAALDDKE